MILSSKSHIMHIYDKNRDCCIETHRDRHYYHISPDAMGDFMDRYIKKILESYMAVFDKKARKRFYS